MKQTIRNKTFETNSSSMHSLIICTDEQLEKLKNNELYIDRYGKVDEFYSIEDIEKEFESVKQDYIKEGYDEEDAFEDFLIDNDYCTLDNWYADLEEDDTAYTTKSGDKINILCKFGYDG